MMKTFYFDTDCCIPLIMKKTPVLDGLAIFSTVRFIRDEHQFFLSALPNDVCGPVLKSLDFTKGK